MNMYLIQLGNEYLYPIDLSTQRPIYRKDAYGNEYYEEYNDGFLIGSSPNDNQMYARDKDGNEIYPPDNSYAKRTNGDGFYASTNDGKTIFPKSSRGDEYYLFFVDESKSDTVPNRYAKLATNAEIYPKKLVSQLIDSEVYLHNKYAVDENGKAYYAKDCYNNEYYRTQQANESVEDILLERYAVTNDGKIIVPYNVKSRTFYIDPNKELILDKNVLGRLIRLGNPTPVYDYVTDIETRITAPRKTYHYIDRFSDDIVCVLAPQLPKTCNIVGIFNNPELPFYKTCIFWIPLIILLILKIFVVWWFYLRKP